MTLPEKKHISLVLKWLIVPLLMVLMFPLVFPLVHDHIGPDERKAAHADDPGAQGAWKPEWIVQWIAEPVSSVATEDIGRMAVCSSEMELAPNPTLVSYFEGLFSTEHWPARWYCGQWSGVDGWIYIGSDISIFLAYMTIPFILFFFMRKRKRAPFHKFFLLFGIFIILCGVTHLIDVIIFWEPMYRLSGFVRLLTGIASWGTAVALIYAIPVALTYRSPDEMQAEIEERQRIERELKQTNETLVLALKGAKAGLFSYNIKTDEAHWDSATAAFLGYPDPMVMDHKGFLDHVVPEDKHIIEDLVSWDFDTIDVTYRIMSNNGKVKYINSKALLERDKNGEPLRVVGVNYDVTEQKMAEKERNAMWDRLSQVNRLLTETSELGRIASWEINVETGSVYWSEVLYDIMEIPRGTPVTFGIWSSFFEERDHPRLRAAIQKMQDRIGEKVSLELQTCTEEQNQLWIRLEGTSSKKDDGPVIIRGLLQDIDEKKHSEIILNNANKILEQRVEERTKELEQVNKELETFSYSASHDLQTPLRHIRSFVTLLSSSIGDHPKNDKVAEYIGFISQASERMSVLIEDLLEFSRSGSKNLEKRMVPVAPLIREVIKELTTNNDGKTIDWKISDHLGDVYADPMSIKLVFQNLLSNAAKFSRNRNQPMVEINAVEEKDQVKVSVQDNGVGFDEKYRDKLFGVFKRLHSEREFEGTGIGLATVQRVVAKHGGTVGASSVLGRGATFYITLPKKRIE